MKAFAAVSSTTVVAVGAAVQLHFNPKAAVSEEGPASMWSGVHRAGEAPLIR